MIIVTPEVDNATCPLGMTKLSSQSANTFNKSELSHMRTEQFRNSETGRCCCCEAATCTGTAVIQRSSVSDDNRPCKLFFRHRILNVVNVVLNDISHDGCRGTGSREQAHARINIGGMAGSIGNFSQLFKTSKGKKLQLV